MRIDRRSDDGIQVRCSAGHVFRRQVLGPTVECPICGDTGVTTDLMAEYYAPRSEADEVPVGKPAVPL